MLPQVRVRGVAAAARRLGCGLRYAGAWDWKAAFDAEGNPDASGSPAVLKLVQTDGSQIRFDAGTGDALSIRTPQGRLVSAADCRQCQDRYG